MGQTLLTVARLRIALVCAVLGAVLAPRAAGSTVAAAASGTTWQLPTLEQAIEDSPEDLRLAADYRQLAISSGLFNRATDFFERLAKRKDTGPNLLISLALSYVDKVPLAGEFRRAYLGRDAMNALTKSIALRPTVLAYYIRGRINLYYDRFIFRRVDKGIADLTDALRMIASDTPPPLAALVYTTLGDAYLKDDNPIKAREVWSTGTRRFPADLGLKVRLDREGPELWKVVGPGLSPSRRQDTTLEGLLPLSQ